MSNRFYRYLTGGMPWAMLVAVVFIVILIVLASSVIVQDQNTRPVPSGDDARIAALASEHSPTIGDPDAPVHIVDFLDPACGTCAMFYPMVKGWLEEAPGKLRVSIRHVAFHPGAEEAIRVLEASREQDRYWDTLEALLASQDQWTRNHTVLPDRILPAIGGVGLDMNRLTADMHGPDIGVRMERDHNDAVLLKVSATPEYFVNGRPLPSFGQQQLIDLVREELAKAEQAN